MAAKTFTIRPKGGGDYTTLQAAVNALLADNGDGPYTLQFGRGFAGNASADWDTWSGGIDLVLNLTVDTDAGAIPGFQDENTVACVGLFDMSSGALSAPIGTLTVGAVQLGNNSTIGKLYNTSGDIDWSEIVISRAKIAIPIYQGASGSKNFITLNCGPSCTINISDCSGYSAATQSAIINFFSVGDTNQTLQINASSNQFDLTGLNNTASSVIHVTDMGSGTLTFDVRRNIACGAAATQGCFIRTDTATGVSTAATSTANAVSGTGEAYIGTNPLTGILASQVWGQRTAGNYALLMTVNATDATAFSDVALALNATRILNTSGTAASNVTVTLYGQWSTTTSYTADMSLSGSETTGNMWPFNLTLDNAAGAFLNSTLVLQRFGCTNQALEGGTLTINNPILGTSSTVGAISITTLSTNGTTSVLIVNPLIHDTASRGASGSRTVLNISVGGNTGTALNPDGGIAPTIRITNPVFSGQSSQGSNVTVIKIADTNGGTAFASFPITVQFGSLDLNRLNANSVGIAIVGNSSLAGSVYNIDLDQNLILGASAHGFTQTNFSSHTFNYTGGYNTTTDTSSALMGANSVTGVASTLWPNRTAENYTILSVNATNAAYEVTATSPVATDYNGASRPQLYAGNLTLFGGAFNTLATPPLTTPAALTRNGTGLDLTGGFTDADHITATYSINGVAQDAVSQDGASFSLTLAGAATKYVVATLTAYDASDNALARGLVTYDATTLTSGQLLVLNIL